MGKTECEWFSKAYAFILDLTVIIMRIKMQLLNLNEHKSLKNCKL